MDGFGRDKENVRIGKHTASGDTFQSTFQRSVTIVIQLFRSTGLCIHQDLLDNTIVPWPSLPYVLGSSSTLEADPFLNICFAAVMIDAGLPSFEFTDQTLLRRGGISSSLTAATIALVTDGRPSIMSVRGSRSLRLMTSYAYVGCRLLQRHG